MSDQAHDTTQAITDDAIARRAYEIWESRGCPEDDGNDNWEAAKLQLMAEADSGEACTEAECDSRRGPLLRFFDRLRSRAA